MLVHAKTIGLQKDSVRRSLKHVLPRIEKDIHIIQLRLVPILSYLTDDNMAFRLKQVAVRYSQISSNIKTYEIDSSNNIDNPCFDSS